MKTSNKILLIALAALAALVIATALVWRASSGGFVTKVMPAERVTRTEDLRDFNAVRVSSVWDLRITRGDAYSVVVTAPQYALENLIVTKEGNTLRLDQRHSVRRPPAARISAAITMPEITDLDYSGVATIKLSGFTGRSLRVVSSGAGVISCRDSTFDDLLVTLSGVGSVDFSEAKTKNVDVELSGLGSVKLHMAGGELRGDLSGLGSIEYSGQVSAERINKSGLGSVEHK
jgi:hypothetical protein